MADTQGGIAYKSKQPRPAKILVCVICGAPFRPKFSGARCCGSKCGNLLSHKSRSERALRDKTRVCEQCGKSFVMKTGGAGFCGESNEGRFCSRLCCYASRRVYPDKLSARRAEKRRLRDRLGLPPLPTPGNVNCKSCGNLFIQKNTRNIICSEECRKLYYNKRDRSERKCKGCGGDFSPEYGDHRRVFCSTQCNARYIRKKYGHKYRDRARAHGVPYEAVNILVVFERDKWTCQVCGVKTPQRLRGKFQDNAPELDHRIPMAMGGAHSYENVQCACRKCNILKSGNAIRGQLSLFPVPLEVSVS